MSDGAHDLVSTGDTGRGHVAVCSCGWTSIPASQQHAQARWRSHLAGRKAAASCELARTTIRVARSRVAELAEMRAETIARRADLQEQRVQLAKASARRREESALAPTPYERAQLLERARDFAAMSHTDLWCAYFALGGYLPKDVLADVLHSRRTTSHWELNLVTVALNEKFADEGFGYPLEYWPRH